MNTKIFKDELISKIKLFSPSDQNDILRAYVFANKKHLHQKRKSGEPYINHPVRVAINLAAHKYDKVSIIAGLLHDTIEDTETIFNEIECNFSKETALIVDGVTKVSNIRVKKSVIFSDEELFLNQVDNYRKILLATITDLRVIIIKLFDRLDNISTIEYIDPKKRKFYARETIEIFAPIAERLGIGELKGLLEDLSFPHAYPSDYERFLPIINIAYKNPQETVKRLIPKVKNALQKSKIKYKNIAGRAKHHYSLYQKFKNKGSIDQIFDIVALRVIVFNVEDCYKSLGTLHSLFKPVPGRIFDYIARPKQNGYQSLHTTVYDEFSNVFEIQIRTFDMHSSAEYGQSAHWNYKENTTSKSAAEWLSELDKIKEIKSGKDLIKQIKEELFSKKIFVFSPKGEIIDLPAGSTGIDYAYRIHSDIGNTCCGIKINNRIMSLKTALQTGDTVEIITSPKAHPTKDWVKFVKTSSARSRIRNWLRETYFDNYKSTGQRLIAELIALHDLPKYKINDSNKLIKDSALPYNDIDTALAAVGENTIGKYKLIKILYPDHDFNKKKRSTPIKTVRTKLKSLQDIAHVFSKCCNPKIGDQIIGYISSDHVIKIHKINCSKIKNADKNRIISVN